MDKNLLKSLMEVKDYPCVSILLPTHRTAPENQKNAIRLKKMVREAAEKLEQEFGKRDAKSLIEKIKVLAANVDISRTLDGLALYVNKDVSRMVDIPFRVRERVIIDKTFATRDLIKGVNRGTSYFVLDLSLHRARLLSCFRENATEITENGFPMQSEFEMLELNPTDFSREKKKQIREFFNKVDKTFLANYKFESNKLVIAGVQKNLALFKEVADVKNIIYEQLEGNYETTSAHDLGKKAWELVREKNNKERHEAINEVQKAVGLQKLATGISETWRFANEGRIGLLVIEEDYHVSAAEGENNNLILDISDVDEKDIMPDAVDEVAEVVLEKGGNVIFVDNGSLSKYNKIAGILRY